MFRLLKVTGDSLSPEYQDGDFVFIFRAPYCLGGIKPGDVVVFRHEPYGTLIKIVESLDSELEEVYVTGVHPDSIDSRHFGTIHGKNLIGKVIGHFKKN